MDSTGTMLTGGGLVTLVIEAIKYIWRKFVAKDMAFDFPPLFYLILVPALNAVAPFALVALGVAAQDPILGMGWQAILAYVGRIVLGSLISLVAYNDGVSPLKAKIRESQSLTVA
jgi:hypothetical protein